MTLRSRMAATAGVAVALAVLAVAGSVYIAVRSELRGQVDQGLSDRARPLVSGRTADSDVARGGDPGGSLGVSAAASLAPFGGPSGHVQFVAADGTVTEPPDERSSPLVPADARARGIAARGQGRLFRDIHVGSLHLRVLTVGRPGGAVQVFRPLTEVDHELSHVLVVLLIVGTTGIALAALLGGVVARAALAPIGRFTRRTEALAANPDPAQRLEVVGADELARLARSFNSTLDALERSVEAQRNLVADASHELRTPISSLRANIQVLQEAERLTPEDRESLRADVISELDELTALVGDVVELARRARPPEALDDVRLDEVVAAAVERTRRRAGSIGFDVELQGAVVRGEADRIGRAVSNLLDNARKWSPVQGLIEVRLADGVLSVRDHGPGFDEHDLPHVFDRFYRAQRARGLPGSGLGLAIVRQAAEAHGGWARARNAAGGGAVLEVSFGPGSAAAAQ